MTKNLLFYLFIALLDYPLSSFADPAKELKPVSPKAVKSTGTIKDDSE